MASSVTLYYQPPNHAYQVAGILTFDPAAKKWADPGAAPEASPRQILSVEHSKNAVYDPVTDSIWRGGQDNGGSAMFDQYHIATNTWDVYPTPTSTKGIYI